MGDDGAAVAVGEGSDAGLQQGEVGVVPAVQRELAHGLFADQETEFRVGGIDHGGAFDDGHLLFERPDFEGDVDVDRVADVEVDPLAQERPEAGLFNSELIVGGREVAERECAGGGGLGSACETCRGLEGGHAGAGDGGAGGVVDGAREARGSLGEERRASQQSENE